MTRMTKIILIITCSISAIAYDSLYGVIITNETEKSVKITIKSVKEGSPAIISSWLPSKTAYHYEIFENAFYDIGVTDYTNNRTTNTFHYIDDSTRLVIEKTINNNVACVKYSNN